uniref:Mitochondrial fission factor n=1 Tax=Monopterus albus TaxID=43700 RepID=A0A3Q3IHC2_MONAL
MSRPIFTSTSAEVAEMNRIHYELEYTEGISQQMRIPETLKVAPENQTGSLPLQQPLVCVCDDGDPRFVCPRDLDLIQSIPPVDLLSMKAPPRVLTLTEQPLDSLETDQTASSQSNPSQAHFHSRSRRERSNTVSLLLHLIWLFFGLKKCFLSLLFLPTHLSASVIPSPSAPPVRLCPPLYSPEDANTHLFTVAGFLSYVQSTTRRAYQQVLEFLDDSHRRTPGLALTHCDQFYIGENIFLCHVISQIVKLNRRLHLLEEENKERSKREVVLYSATVAFWLFNTWIWFRR